MRWIFAMAALGILLTGPSFAQEAPETEAPVEAPGPSPPIEPDVETNAIS